MYFTNNSSRTPEEVAAKLARMGFSAAPDEVVTSAQMSAFLLGQRWQPGSRVAYIGGSGLSQALRVAELEPIYVPASSIEDLAQCTGAAVGIDQTVSYSDLARLCDVVMRLGWFVLTNADVRLPHGDRFLPGNGALGRFVATATGIEPVVAGKPEPAYVDYALKRFNCSKEQAVIIGDNLFTDILAGERVGSCRFWCRPVYAIMT